MASRGGGAWRPASAGFSAVLVGIGLARFAYTPLIPALIAAGWFTPPAAVYLGAANLAGYLAGALLARPMAARSPAPAVLRTMMALVAASLLACAIPLSFAWFFAWRFAAGLAGGTIMVLAAPTVLPHVPPARRGLVSGVIFMGVGCGIAASGTLLPLLLRFGLAATWLGLGALSAVLTLIAWSGWPHDAAQSVAARMHPTTIGLHAAHQPFTMATRGLLVAYGLNAVGLVPHMVFLADFVARGLGRGLAAGSHIWVLYGLGAIAGPLVTGHVADRIGFKRALRLAYLIQAGGVALLLLTANGPGLGLSSVVVGAFTPGIVPLVLGRLHELEARDAAAQRAAWAAATTAFALCQAASAYGYSFLFARTGGAYSLLFALGAGAFVLAFAIDLVTAAADRRQATRAAKT